MPPLTGCILKFQIDPAGVSDESDKESDEGDAD